MTMLERMKAHIKGRTPEDLRNEFLEITKGDNYNKTMSLHKQAEEYFKSEYWKKLQGTDPFTIKVMAEFAEHVHGNHIKELEQRIEDLERSIQSYKHWSGHM